MVISKKLYVNKLKDEKISKLESKNKKLNIKLEKLIAKYENKVERNKKIQAERFLPKTEEKKIK